MSDNAEASKVAKKVERVQKQAGANAVRLEEKGREPITIETNQGAYAHDEPTMMAEQFPTDALQASHPRDVISSAKLESSTGDGVTPFGKLIASDADFDWLRSKYKAQEYANFEQWFAKEFDKLGPAQKATARKLFPRFYAERQKRLNEDAELLRRAASIKLNGVKSKEDLMLLYALDTGRVDTHRLNSLLFPEAAQSDAKAREAYNRGLLNPRRFVQGNQGVFGRDANRKEVLGVPGGADNAQYGVSSGVAPMGAGGNLTLGGLINRYQRDGRLTSAGGAGGGAAAMDTTE